MNDDRRPFPQPTPQGFPSQITVTVNVVVSGRLVVEFISTSVDDSADLAALAGRVGAADASLKATIDATPKP